MKYQSRASCWCTALSRLCRVAGSARAVPGGCQGVSSPRSRGCGRRAAPRCGHTEQAVGTAVWRPRECGAGQGTWGPGAATLKVARLGHSCSPARLRHKSRDPTRAGCAGGRGHAATSETAARRGSCAMLPVRDEDSRYRSRAPQTASIKPRALLKGSHQTEQVRSRRFRLQSHVVFSALTR